MIVVFYFESPIKNIFFYFNISFNISQYFEKTGENGFHLMPEYNSFLKSLPYNSMLISKSPQKHLGCKNISVKIKVNPKTGKI
jgi:hypothetical protein